MAYHGRWSPCGVFDVFLIATWVCLFWCDALCRTNLHTLHGLFSWCWDVNLCFCVLGCAFLRWSIQVIQGSLHVELYSGETNLGRSCSYSCFPRTTTFATCIRSLKNKSMSPSCMFTSLAATYGRVETILRVHVKTWLTVRSLVTGQDQDTWSRPDFELRRYWSCPIS